MKSRIGRSKVILLGLVFLLSGFSTTGTEAGAVADNLTGIWYFPYKRAYIEITRAPSAQYTGRIVGVRDKSYIPYLDQVVIDGLRYEKGNWEGTFVHPTMHTRLGVSMNMNGSERIEALIYKGHRMIGKTFDMQRSELPGNVYVAKK